MFNLIVKLRDKIYFQQLRAHASVVFAPAVTSLQSTLDTSFFPSSWRSSLPNKESHLLLAADFKYRLDKTTTTTKLWRCTKRGCLARCKTNLEGTEALGFTNQHDHDEGSQSDIQLQKLRQQCKRKATEDPFERQSKIIRKQVFEADGNGGGEFLPSDIASARRAIYRKRRQNLPRLPQNRRETHQALADFTLKSNRGEDIILINDEENGIFCQFSFFFFSLLKSFILVLIPFNFGAN